MKVVVAIDSSPSAQTILDSVLHRPWPIKTTFCVLSIVNIQRFERIPALIEDATREAEQLVKIGANKLVSAGYEAFPMTSPGNPRREISCYAKEWGADLIVVGSHGHSAFGRLLLGSVAQAVLRNAPCSVEMVRRSQAHETSPRYNVLFATDGSDCSNAAAHAIAETVWPKDAVFKIISVEELVLAGNEMEAMSISPIYPASLLEKLTNDARERADSAVETAKTTLAAAKLQIDAENSKPTGEPRAVLLDLAKDWRADLIVLGSHGRRGWDRFLLGSVSEGIAVHAPCSVRVMRTPQAS